MSTALLILRFYINRSERIEFSSRLAPYIKYENKIRSNGLKKYSEES